MCKRVTDDQTVTKLAVILGLENLFKRVEMDEKSKSPSPAGAFDGIEDLEDTISKTV